MVFDQVKIALEYVPRATYRLQLHAAFTFADATRIVPYLARLGISHLYLSPIQSAQHGSTHGYDIVDHERINDELGGDAGLDALAATARRHGLKLLVDIVPNHAGVGGSRNAWWLSCLEWGRRSPLSHVFDIGWDRAEADGKILLPFLAQPYCETLASGAIALRFDEDSGSFSFWHHEHRFPLCPLHYPDVLDLAIASGRNVSDEILEEMISVGGVLRQLAEEPESVDVVSTANVQKARLQELGRFPSFLDSVQAGLAIINGNQGKKEDRPALHTLLERQNYRLAHWRAADGDLNYRRFFEITSLAGLRCEDADVFNRIHMVILDRVRREHIHGLRVDHIDGLSDPAGYLKKLRAETGQDIYLAVEKILGENENLRPWPIQGTTGYDVLNLVDGLFVAREHEERFEEVYHVLCGYDPGPLFRVKEEIVSRSFSSESEALVAVLHGLAKGSVETRDVTKPQISRSVLALVGELPVYRTYHDDGEPSQDDVSLLESARSRIAERGFLDLSALDFVIDLMRGRILASRPFDLAQARRMFQQLSGPAMAKSLEDTYFYRDARFIACNEVGAHAGGFGVSIEEFHRENIERAALHPHTMIASATHDTKRGEDMRARLAVVSEMPEVWFELARSFILSDAVLEMPDRNDRYFLLQTIVGAWPLECLAEDGDLTEFRSRITGYARKALREAKRHSNWVSPNLVYEEAAENWCSTVLDASHPMHEALRRFVARIAPAGLLNGLARTILKGTIPGIPDFYQGTEFWDFSLVDPDNRRPVDYEAREAALDEGQAIHAVKQQLIRTMLEDRAEAARLYACGSYRPLAVQGPRMDHIVAFAREWNDDARIIIIACGLGRLVGEDGKLSAGLWEKMRCDIPAGMWTDVLSGRRVMGEASLPEILLDAPGVLLRKADG